jgi:hypothetical protein
MILRVKKPWSTLHAEVYGESVKTIIPSADPKADPLVVPKKKVRIENQKLSITW